MKSIKHLREFENIRCVDASNMDAVFDIIVRNYTDAEVRAVYDEIVAHGFPKPTHDWTVSYLYMDQIGCSTAATYTMDLRLVEHFKAAFPERV